MSEIAVSRGAVIVTTLIVLFSLAVFVVSLVVGYIGDEYVSPALSEQSVPPARRY
jgi:uncharacterized membrane protein